MFEVSQILEFYGSPWEQDASTRYVPAMQDILRELCREKSKSPQFPGPGAVRTASGWCIKNLNKNCQVNTKCALRELAFKMGNLV